MEGQSYGGGTPFLHSIAQQNISIVGVYIYRENYTAHFRPKLRNEIIRLGVVFSSKTYLAKNAQRPWYYLSLALSKTGRRPVYFMRTLRTPFHPQSEHLSHTACKDDLRRHPPSLSRTQYVVNFFLYFIKNEARDLATR